MLYIKAQAKSRIDIKADLEEHTLACMEALAQLYLFPSAQERNHWRTEVWNHYRVMSKCKPRNKYLSKDEILKCTWGEHQDHVRMMMKHAIAHEESYKPDYYRNSDEETLKEIMEQYFIFIADSLSSTGFVDPDESYAKLEELGL